ncbi:MAG: hypothetical protein GY814_16850 [Gammaproteobacteria bacterium]|nr:hypothetical protein [Gammaproteobacteria bacterium]
MNTKTILQNWGLLNFLVALWGSSFMVIAISVDTIDPVSVVFYRLALGARVWAFVDY